MIFLRIRYKKLKNEQFTLLYKLRTKAIVTEVDIVNIKQKLCLPYSLSIPYQSELQLEHEYQIAVKGFYVNYGIFKSIENRNNLYYIPAKKDWGVNPAINKKWQAFQEIEMKLNESMEENKVVLCWQKNKGNYSEFFIV